MVGACGGRISGAALLNGIAPWGRGGNAEVCRGCSVVDRLSEELGDDLAVDIGKAEVAALEPVR